MEQEESSQTIPAGLIMGFIILNALIVVFFYLTSFQQRMAEQKNLTEILLQKEESLRVHQDEVKRLPELKKAREEGIRDLKHQMEAEFSPMTAGEFEAFFYGIIEKTAKGMRKDSGKSQITFSKVSKDERSSFDPNFEVGTFDGTRIIKGTGISWGEFSLKFTGTSAAFVEFLSRLAKEDSKGLLSVDRIVMDAGDIKNINGEPVLTIYMKVVAYYRNKTGK